MPFLKKYPIVADYIPINTKRRSGLAVSPSVKFIVAHDTGNSGSTARQNVNYYKSSANATNASAHIFVDDKEIIECIPALTASPEKAWHVRYDVTGDNQMYGYDANDVAIGVEYCFGTNINATEAYKRYVWTLAYICYQFNLNPQTAIIGHCFLDPSRRTDPRSGLAVSGRTYEQLLLDVKTEYNNCQNNNMKMSLIRISNSPKVYAIGGDNKRYWIFNEETFNVGRVMGLWGGLGEVQVVASDSHVDGHAIILIK
ncbi:MAG: peptidoglycan recognition family protein [Patescibacteria group bacterium]|jgi:N-acetylmuramoyl-L-alanine amidase CwlA